jgi:hypothetical protein
MWPVASAPPDSLAKYGFVHEPARNPADLLTAPGPVYFGPDAKILFSDWFLDGHCFSVLSPTEAANDIVVAFAPARGARRDIRGKLTLDRQTLELRALDFWYTGLGRWVTGDSAGGRLSFRRLTTGAWIIDRWVIRAPIPLVGRRDTVLFGFAESGGQVKEIRDGRSGKVETISRAVPELPSGGQPVTYSLPFPLIRSHLCAHRCGCWAELSSFPSSRPDTPGHSSAKWMAGVISHPIGSRPART